MMEKISLNQFSVMQLRYTLNLSRDEMLIKKKPHIFKAEAQNIFNSEKTSTTSVHLLLDPRAISRTEMGYPFP